MTFIVPIVGSGLGVVNRTFLGGKVSNNLTPPVTLNYTGYTTSSPPDDRKIIACLGTQFTTATALASVTIFGVAATQVVQAQNGAGHVSIYIAEVPKSITTGDVVVTGNGTMVRGWCGAYEISGIFDQPAFDTLGVAGNSGNLDVPEKGICLAVAIANIGGHSWTGLTEDFEQDLGSVTTGSFASAEFAAASANHAVSATTSTFPSLCAASWEP